MVFAASHLQGSEQVRTSFRTSLCMASWTEGLSTILERFAVTNFWQAHGIPCEPFAQHRAQHPVGLGLHQESFGSDPLFAIIKIQLDRRSFQAETLYYVLATQESSIHHGMIH